MTEQEHELFLKLIETPSHKLSDEELDIKSKLIAKATPKDYPDNGSKSRPIIGTLAKGIFTPFQSDFNSFNVPKNLRPCEDGVYVAEMACNKFGELTGEVISITS